jgi:hypothetical protein
MPSKSIIQLYLNCELRTANCELERRWHLKRFFDNPPQHLKKRIAEIDPEAINYLLGRRAS